MKLALNALAFGPRIRINLDLVRHAERLGFDSAWTALASRSVKATHFPSGDSSWPAMERHFV